MVFHEVQRAQEWWLWAIAIGVAIPLFVVAAVIVRVARRASSRALRGLLLGAAAVTAATGLAPGAFIASLSMTTDVGDAGLHVAITPFILDDTIPFDAIVRAEVRQYDPIAEYGGWGVRVGRDGHAYNMTGNRGVQLELAAGRPRLLIGSQRPEELAEALEARRR